MNVYQYGSSGPMPIRSTPAPITSPKLAPVVPGVTALGCYTDSPSGRIMTLTLDDLEMTTAVRDVAH